MDKRSTPTPTPPQVGAHAPRGIIGKKEGGRSVGADPDLFDTHSFRIGGATAMYHGSGDYFLGQIL